MKDKMYDFGTLGKWSEQTLIAQSSISRNNTFMEWKAKLPDIVEEKAKKWGEDISNERAKKVKKLDLFDIEWGLFKIKALEKYLEDYERMKKTVLEMLLKKEGKGKKK